MDKNNGYLLVFLTAVISGFSIFINKFSVSVINPYIFTGLKNLAVAVFLTSCLFLLKDFKALKSLSRKDWLLLVAIGLIGGSAPFLLFFKGLSLTSAAFGSFIHKTMFLYIILGASLFLKEKINKEFLIGALLLFLGSIILLKTIPHSLGRGDLFIFLATLFWACENIISKHALKKLSGLTVAWGRMFFGSILILMFLSATHQAPLILNLNQSQIIWVLITSILLFGYVMSWYSGLKYVPVSQAACILLLGSPLTTFLFLISSGKVNSQEIFSGIFIVLGIILTISIRETWKAIKKIKNLGYVRA